MGNLLQYTDKSKIIDEKINSMLAIVQHDYNNGNIKTEAEYYYRVKNLITDFYNSLTKPMFKFRPAVTTPISSEYNSMINEAYNDMGYIISDCEMLKDFVSRSFSDAELTRGMMSNKLAMMTRQIESMESQASMVENPDGTIIITELFSDLSQCGNVMDANSLCVDTANSFLRLSAWSYVRLGIDNITIDENESNGLPGTSHTASNLNGELYFDGQDKMGCVIEDNVFIGGNSNILSSVVLGKDSYIAAGSTITSDVPALGLGIGRSKQINKEDWVAKKNRLRGANYIKLDSKRSEV